MHSMFAKTQADWTSLCDFDSNNYVFLHTVRAICVSLPDEGIKHYPNISTFL